MDDLQKMGIKLTFIGDLEGLLHIYRTLPYPLQVRLLKNPNKEQKKELMDRLKKSSLLKGVRLVIEDIEKFCDYWEISIENDFSNVFSSSVFLEYSGFSKRYTLILNKEKFIEKLKIKDEKFWDIIEKYWPGSRLKYLFIGEQGEVIFKRMRLDLLKNVNSINDKVQSRNNSNKIFNLHFEQVIEIIEELLITKESYSE